MSKSVTILGSTGTIGVNTLKCIEAHQGKFSIAALTAGDNATLLAEQARKFRPKLAVIASENRYGELKELLAGTDIEIAAGKDAVCAAAEIGADITVSAIVGTAGLPPTLAAIKCGKTVALANKESLVCAGNLMQQEVEKSGAKLIPVDSEHNGIFQLLEGRKIEHIERVIITASGGPFRTFSREQMQNVSKEQAIKHPNWNMGAKISVDSATMMNKGLELIEAFYLFPLRAEQLQVLVHPQSIIHALIETTDGSVLAQMSNPDMCMPIAHALAYPEKITAPVKKLRLEEIGNLTFEAPDEIRFPALRLAKEAMIAGGAAPVMLNAANEIAVARFLNDDIGFLDIIRIVEKTLETSYIKTIATVEEVQECDATARARAKEI